MVNHQLTLSCAGNLSLKEKLHVRHVFDGKLQSEKRDVRARKNNGDRDDGDRGILHRPPLHLMT